MTHNTKKLCNVKKAIGTITEASLMCGRGSCFHCVAPSLCPIWCIHACGMWWTHVWWLFMFLCGKRYPPTSFTVFDTFITDSIKNWQDATPTTHPLLCDTFFILLSLVSWKAVAFYASCFKYLIEKKAAVSSIPEMLAMAKFID